MPGPQGATGPQGFQGPAGSGSGTSSIGATGSQGSTGPQGFQGNQGPQGFQGDQGPQGFQGGTGPAGSDGISVSYYRYNARTNTQSPPPNNSQIIWNNATQINSTIIYVDHITSDNIDIDVFLALIKTGDNIIIQDANDSTSYQKWVVSATISQTLVYTTIPVTYVAGGHQYTNGENIIFIPLSIGISGPQGVQGFQGPTGSQGATGFTYPVNASTFNELYYNSLDSITPEFSPVLSTTSDGINLYINKGSLFLVNDITNYTIGQIKLTSTTNSSTNGTLSFPSAIDDIVVTQLYTQTLQNKDIAQSSYDNGSIGFTQLVTLHNVGVASGNAAGDIYFRGTSSNLRNLAIGATGSILSVRSGAPIWLQYNLTKTTDGATVSGTVNNTYTDGVLIPANTVSVGDVIEFRTRMRKTGTGGTIVSRLYIGVNNSLTSANLIGTSATNANTTATLQMIRTLAVKSATVSEAFPTAVALNGDDAAVSTSAVTTYNIDWTQNQYFVASIQNSAAGDSSRNSFLSVKIV